VLPPLDMEQQQLLHLSPRRYTQLFILEDICTMLSISGKQQSVSIHDLVPLVTSEHKMRRFSLWQQKFEAKTNSRRIPGSQKCDRFKVGTCIYFVYLFVIYWVFFFSCCCCPAIERLNDSIFLSIYKPKSVLLMRWAPHPFNTFKKVKDITFDRPYVDSAIHEDDNGEIKLVIAYQAYFEIYDVESGVGQSVRIESDVQGSSMPRAILPLSKNRYIMCFDGRHFY